MAEDLDRELGESRWRKERELIEEIASVARTQIERSPPPALRDAHPKAHGCVRAELRVDEELAPRFAHGVFVPGKRYPAWVRFSNGNRDARRADAKGDSRGMAIKLMGVPGEKILPAEKDATTHDFVMIDHPVFAIDDPAKYLRVLQLSNEQGVLSKLRLPFALGVRGALIAAAITSKKIASPLEARYWSTTAYRLGTGEGRVAVKFSCRPSREGESKLPDEPGPDFLRERLAQHLAERDASFEFLVQPRTSPEMSVERASIEWPEADAPFHRVATLHIPQQRFSSAAQDAFGENLSFTPWHALPAHRPLGVVNRVRRVVYEEVSILRHGLNGAPRQEPSGEEAFD